MYIAKEDKIYYCHPNETGSEELFLTVHPTKDCTSTPEQQAIVIANKLNDVNK